MAGRNRAIVSLPVGLLLMIKIYQSDRDLASFNAAVIELLETHPAILTRYHAMLYPEGKP